MPIIRIQSTSESVPPKSFEYFKISCFALTLFFVVTTAPCLRPICLPFLRAVSIPSFVRWCKSETSFSDCSKAFFGFYKRKSKCLILFSFRSTSKKLPTEKEKTLFAARFWYPAKLTLTHAVFQTPKRSIKQRTVRNHQTVLFLDFAFYRKGYTNWGYNYFFSLILDKKIASKANCSFTCLRKAFFLFFAKLKLDLPFCFVNNQTGIKNIDYVLFLKPFIKLV